MIKGVCTEEAEKMGRRATIRQSSSTLGPDAEEKYFSGRRDQENRIRSWKRPQILSPTQMTILMAGAIFLCELFVMFLLTFLPTASGVTDAIIDSSILLILLTPLYLLFYRPFWEEHQNFSREVKHLSRKLLKSAEDERKRISHDLHDQCGQTLTALQFGFETLKKGLPESSTESEDQLKDLSGLLMQLSNEMREVTHRLRPDLLEQLGLVASLRSLVSEFSKNHPQIEIKESYLVDKQGYQRLDSELEVALYRICQECLHNISKYAQAPAIIVILEKRDSSIILNMGDHGVGFDPRPKKQAINNKRKGIGLLGIRERVADLGGTFYLSTEVQKGTFITVEFPLSSGNANE